MSDISLKAMAETVARAGACPEPDSIEMTTAESCECPTCAGTGYVLPATDEVLGSAEPVTIRIAAPVSINIKTDVVELHFRKPQWIHGYVQHITIDRNGEVVGWVDEANAADFWREVALKAAEATDYDYPMNWDAERRLAEIADEVRAARRKAEEA